MFISGCVSADKDTTSVPNSTGNAVDTPVAEAPVTAPEGKQVAAPVPAESVYKYITWDYYVTDKISKYYEAEQGKNYYVVTVHFNNTGTATYSTNPFYWELTADGVTYSTDSVTFSEYVDSKTVDVSPGGKTDVQYAYLVDGNPTNISLNYDEW